MIIAIVIIVIALIGIIIYNSLIAKKNQVDNAFSSIDVMLKKRFDLLPNLVEVVKQYTQHESATLSRLTELRTRAVAPNLSEADKVNLDQQIGAAVKGLMVSVENYPDLKASNNFLNLQSAWTESEEQIAAARRNYNASVTSYNNAIMQFPGNLLAGMLKYSPMPVLAASEQERQSISAKELFKN